MSQIVRVFTKTQDHPHEGIIVCRDHLREILTGDEPPFSLEEIAPDQAGFWSHRCLMCDVSAAPGRRCENVGCRRPLHSQWPAVYCTNLCALKSNVEHERDAYRAMLCDLLASAHPHPIEHPTMTKAWTRARELLSRGPAIDDAEPASSEHRQPSEGAMKIRELARELRAELREAQALSTRREHDEVYPWLIRLASLVDDIIDEIEINARAKAAR